MADRYRRDSRDRDSRDYRDGGYSSRSHNTGHSSFSYNSSSGHRRSPSPVSSHQSRRQSPPPASRMAPAASTIHTMIAHSATAMTLDERFSALKRARSASPSPPPRDRDSLPAGSAKSRQYLDELAHRSDVMDKIEGDNRRARSRDRARSPLAPRAPRPSRPSSNANGSLNRGNGSSGGGDDSQGTSRADRLEATKRIAAARTTRGNIHSRLGIGRTVGGGGGLAGRVGIRPVGRDVPAAGGSGNNRNAYAAFVKHPRPQQQSQAASSQPRRNVAGNGKSATELDNELDAYMKQRA